MADERVLGEIKKGEELIVVSKGVYRGKERLDIRTFWNDGEAWRPSKKGVSVPMESVPTLIKAIQNDGKKPIKA